MRRMLLALAVTLAALPARAETPALDLAALVPRLMPQVVNISFLRHQSASDKLMAMQKDRAALVPSGKGVGTGFVVDANGIICTNHHVTDGSDVIYVTLSDNTRLRAELVYRSPDIDLALLRVHPAHKLTAVSFGDSDAMVPGSAVIAIGNPLGLGGTVTSGIVSARDRDIHDTPLDSYMQIDASINPGNSGGPLFNAAGEVIGMNTALYTVPGAANSGSIGLNFAIPGNDVKLVLDMLRRFGTVRHGTLGASVQDVTGDLADAIGLPMIGGAIVATVAPGSPADKAGLLPGDVILQMGETKIASARTVTRFVIAQPGLRDVKLRLLRKGQETSVTLGIGEMSMGAQKIDMAMMAAPAAALTPDDLGVKGEPVTEALRKRYRLAKTQTGVVVVQVDPAGLGAYLGLSEGSVVTQVQQTPVRSIEDIQAAIKEATRLHRTQAAVLVTDDDGTRWIAVPLTR